MTTIRNRAPTGSPGIVHTAWLLFIGLALLLIQASGASAAKAFPVENFSYYLNEYDAELARLARTVTRTEAEIEADIAAAQEARNARMAAAALEQLLTRRPKDAQLWLSLARALADAQPINESDGWQLPSRLVAAGLRAYSLATTREDEAAALVLAADGLVRREWWRPALQAYRESLRLVEDAEVREAYEQLRAERGFRVSDYKVDSESVPPRACFEFSEPVSRTVTDFSPYVTQEPGPLAAVTAEGSRLCVEALKPGERYTITLRKGIPAAVDDTTAQDQQFSFYVKDRSPSVRFSGNNYVLPRIGQNGIPLVSVNSRAADLRLYQIGDRNLIASVMGSEFRGRIRGYTADDIANRNGRLVWEGAIETPAPLNEDVTVAIPVDETVGRLSPGLYVMTAKPAGVEIEDWDDRATQWFVVSDLGLSTMNGKDGLHVAVRSIASAQPVADVEVRLVARNNEVLATTRTGADGTASFAAGLTRGEGGQAPALVVAQSADHDYSFVDLTQPAFDLTDRGVAGRAPPGAVDAFVYAERGVYRRGETVHVTVLLRDDTARAIEDLPVTLVVERPDGVEYQRSVLDDKGAGGHSLSFGIHPGAQGGTWRIRALTDPEGDPVGETSFLVEDYIPDRIEFDLTAKSARASVAEGAVLAVDGRYLFGAPGAGLDLEASITLGVDDTPFAAWRGYQFGLMDEQVYASQTMIPNLPQTDISGHAEFTVALPELPVTTRPLKADIAVRMREPGGRAVERMVSLPVEARQPMIGIRPQFEGGSVPEGQAAMFQLVAVDKDGRPVAAPEARWVLKQITRDWQWYNADGEWRYEAISRTTRIANGMIGLTAQGPVNFSRALSWGEYRLEVTASGMMPASVDFAVGYYSGGSAKADTPDTLKVALDRTDARPGETITVNIEARHAGKATVQIVGERLLATQTADVTEGSTALTFTVGADWGTGAYVLASLHRPMDVVAKRMPARAMGVAWFGIDRAARTLGVTLDTPPAMRPRGRLSVPVTVSNLAPGEEAFITVAAVDVGILNLTRYNPPAPDRFYFDQKRLSAELRDIYGVLIDGMQGERGRIRSGGDGGAAFNAPPPSQKPLSRYSGIVRVDGTGKAEVMFDIPAFNGTVRVMAVAWTASKVGHGSTDVIVRDPVVVAGTLPRFLSSGDTSRFRFDIVNAEGPAGDYTLGVSIDGPVTAEPAARIQRFTIGGPGSRTTVIVPVTATGTGTASIIATLKGPGDLILDQDFMIGVVPTHPLVTRRTTLPLTANGGALTIGKDLMAGMLPGTASVALSVSPLPELDAAGIVRDLDRYPYGCSEQTVSRAMPLLYLSDLGVDPRAIDGELPDRIKAAVARLVNRQAGNGAFGLWSAYGDDSSLWLSSYVTDFLLRAREQGFEVPEDTLVTGLDYIRNMVGNAPDIAPGAGQDMAYALYVLARAGRAPVGDLKYLADTKIGEFGSPLARAQVAAALAMLGDRQRADMAFASATDALMDAVETTSRSGRNDYGSVLRDASAILALATEAKAQPHVIRTAMNAIEVERARSPHASTQDMAWMVLAARAVAAEARTIRLEAGGTPHEGSFYRVFREDALASDYRIVNQGTAPLRAVVAVTGSPLVAEPAASNGLTVERQYFTIDGQPVDPANIAQNSRLVVVLTASMSGGDTETGQFLLVDPLPAGLEIENPSLVASGSTAALAWLGETTVVGHTEFRDDRFVASFTSSTAKLAYMVRAVAPGTYAHAGAFIEDMYRPQLNARTAAGTVTVTAAP